MTILAAMGRRRTAGIELAMPAGAVLLFDAAVGVSLATGGPYEVGGEYAVTSWENQGDGVAAADDSAGATYRPLWSPGAALGDFAGIPYVRFVAGADVLSMPGGYWGDSVPRGDRDWTHVVVMRQVSGDRIVQATPTAIGFQLGRLAAYDPGAAMWRVLEATPTLPRAVVLSTRLTAAQSQGWVGRAEGATSPAAGGQSGTAGTTSSLGSRPVVPPSLGIDGSIYFLAVYDRALSDAELDAAWDYLEDRFPAAFA